MLLSPVMDDCPLRQPHDESTFPSSQRLRKSPASHVERGWKADNNATLDGERAPHVKADKKGESKCETGGGSSSGGSADAASGG
jgi:hypothetical protein